LNFVSLTNPAVVHAPAGKKGGVNLPRHRVKYYFIESGSGVKCPGRKKKE